MAIFLALIIFFIWVVLSIVVWSIRTGISPMPTSGKGKECLFKSLPGEIEGTIFELGSGWGTLAFPLAERYPNSQVKAYETSPIPYLFSKLRHFFFPHKNLTIERKDFFQVSLDEASLIVCYLYPGAMQRLKGKLEQELTPGAWVVSNTFAIPGWTPHKTYTVNDFYRTKILVYQI